MRKRYSEDQINKAINQHEAGIKVNPICWELGTSNRTLHLAQQACWPRND
jgi:putative transposase